MAAQPPLDPVGAARAQGRAPGALHPLRILGVVAGEALGARVADRAVIAVELLVGIGLLARLDGEDPDELRQRVRERPVARLAGLPGGDLLLLAPVGLVQAQLPDHDGGQILELAPLRLAEGAGGGVEQAERADAQVRPEDQRRASVEADPGRAGHQRAVAEALVCRSVRADQDLVGEDGIGAEGALARDRRAVRAAGGPEAEMVRIDEGDQRHGHAEQARGRAADRVEMHGGFGAEVAERTEGCEPRGLIACDRKRHLNRPLIPHVGLSTPVITRPGRSPLRRMPVRRREARQDAAP